MTLLGQNIYLFMLFLSAAILQPMKAHIHGFGTFWLHPFVDDAFDG
jgi:hypothetical protein